MLRALGSQKLTAADTIPADSLIQMASTYLPLSICSKPFHSRFHFSPLQIRILRTALAANFQEFSARGDFAAGQKTEVRDGGEPNKSEGLPEEFFDDKWQAQQREKTREWHAYRKKEEEMENRKDDEYREIGLRLKGYPQEEVREARKLVSSFIRAEEEVEAKIEAAAEKGQLTELILMVIWNRLDLARRDEEKDVIRSLDLLYRRVEMEILKREATASMRLLNDLLNLYDGHDDEVWLSKCQKCMIDTFPREDPYSILAPASFDINNHQGRIGMPLEDDEILLRSDFIREVDKLLQEVKAENQTSAPLGLDPESVASGLKLQEKKRTIRQVETLLELAMKLKW